MRICLLCKLDHPGWESCKKAAARIRREQMGEGVAFPTVVGTFEIGEDEAPAITKAKEDLKRVPQKIPRKEGTGVQTFECPVCVARRKRKAEKMAKYRAKLKEKGP